MPLDSKVRDFLNARAAANAPPHEAISPVEARAAQESLPRLPGPELASVTDQVIPGPHGDIPVRVYKPEGDLGMPVTAWFHGGGWVVGSIATNDPTCRYLAKLSGTIVVSVEYHLAPEYKFPVQLDDCYTVMCWIAEHAESFGGDPTRVAVSGGSAGGNLAAAVALRARDEGGPLLSHQLLVYPVIERAFETSSYVESGQGYGLSLANMRYYWECYLRDGSDATNPYIAPIHAEDLAGLPNAHIITAEFDPLRDEGEAYAKRLTEAGVPTVCTRYDGMIHAFFTAGTPFEQTLAALSEAAEELRKAFAL